MLFEHSRLTPYEERVMSLVAEALSNREIAERLRVTPNAIKKVNYSICNKMGFKNRVEMAVCYVTRMNS